jgi:hypothetical protein
MSASAFVSEYNGISKRLETEAVVVYKGNSITVRALWDTGATSTCISMDVVAALNLVPLGKLNILTPSGASHANTYQVDILLPNNVVAKNVVVCDSEIGAQQIGLLIGMDIICKGDFAVSNFKGKTLLCINNWSVNYKAARRSRYF